jgi:hypothetical protein
LVFHASDLRSVSWRAYVQLGPYQFVLGSVMVVQPGDDEVQMIADDCGSLAVASLDVTDKIGSDVQLGTEDSMDDRHVECVARHRRSVCLEIATSAVISSQWQPLGSSR